MLNYGNAPFQPVHSIQVFLRLQSILPGDLDKRAKEVVERQKKAPETKLATWAGKSSPTRLASRILGTGAFWVESNRRDGFLEKEQEKTWS